MHFSRSESRREEKEAEVVSGRARRICSRNFEDITRLSASGTSRRGVLFAEGSCEEVTLNAPPIEAVGSFRLFLKVNFCFGAKALRVSESFSESARIC